MRQSDDNGATEFATLDEIREAALGKLSDAASDYLEGGAGDETTLRRNRRAFERWAFVPRVMSGQPTPATASRFLGVELALPILTAPFGADGLFHPDGHVAVARANAATGTVSIVPEAGSHSLERIAAAAPRAAAFGQVHPLGTDEGFLRIVRRYAEAGYRAICVTCDVPIMGRRERDLRNRYLPDYALFGGNYATIDEAFRQLGQLIERETPVWPWSRLGGLLAQVGLPWMAKGIMTADDARAAVAAGASALVVSNHGGRQLDGQRASLDALPEIRDAVGPAVELALDSGIRNGADVVKAIALGADAVVLGRLAVYGLAAGGEAGLCRVFELLRAEITTILTLLGRGSLTDLTPAALIRAEPD
ncbi:alpha-hydroxy acid oxidase [Phytohabitans houttuyneae]|uniref:Alpha-hydroxy-acid oxidizing enzyme n=1 Tax=Phytohabitans houttuyneae TaxID=1076126 RepID=A0A6V8K658_9ACTN|nr:alpha-hydroxy acid oxidase [Phytohabitans houttuyneae]GFJ77237.1 alpha-hydroxy-acid oxidizing enzyme [Phytohabitans houttuyneae]